jgi:hypothetical protein
VRVILQISVVHKVVATLADRELVIVHVHHSILLRVELTAGKG